MQPAIAVPDSVRAAPNLRPATTRADSVQPDGALIDRYGRRVSYIRLSVTDRCDFRCAYCMPLKMKFLPKADILSLEELLRVARVFAGLGVNKIRVSGGEPLVRRGVVGLCADLASIPGVREVAMTTNGSQLPRFASGLASAGVGRVNISLDTLDPSRFRALTRTGELDSVLRGIESAKRANFRGVKINAVMMRGFNDDEIVPLARFAMDNELDISYIEEMPLGDIGHSRAETYYSADDAMAQLREKFDLQASDYKSGGPARYWNVAGSRTRVGFITPHSHNFCANCNRVRITAVGQLFPCLGQNDMVDLKPALRDSNGSANGSANGNANGDGDPGRDSLLRDRIMRGLDIKPKGHEFDLSEPGAKVVRFMSATGG